ncbi:ATPase AAA [Candidatus Thiomargarita nelsonii]|uniref:ATPase AAA n=1 Tax=Candidatus Thiomargarita nelsonii TaxID=1003181 RepID=A0A0A6PMQ1_9GAMM|nr:ATPase AAA [Candidatus Thiomargarita nelsonii]
MRLDQLFVQNFKGFEHKNIQFSPQFNVLSGDNATGKTAILDAIAVGIGALFLGFDSISSRPIRTSEIRHIGYPLGAELKLEPYPPAIVRCSGEMVDSGIITWERSLLKPGSRTTYQNAKSIIDKAKQLQKRVRAGDQSLILPVLSYYGTGRLWLQKSGRVETIKPDSRLSKYEGCLEPASDEKRFIRWLKTMEIAALQRQIPIGVLECLRKSIRNCLEGCESVYFDIPHDELITTLLPNNQSLPAYMLSDGQRIILAMVADIAYKAASLNSQLEEKAALETPGIVLIDEIDLHLHPNWQRKIVDSLKTTFPKIQFIATTHSPFIIQSLREGELIDLNESEPAEYEDQSIENIAEYKMGVEIPQRSQRYLEMMTAAKEYYRVLEQAKDVPLEKIESLKNRLDELSAPFSENIAYHAFLEMQREAAGLGRNADETY